LDTAVAIVAESGIGMAFFSVSRCGKSESAGIRKGRRILGRLYS
jgi:hypothetical protein